MHSAAHVEITPGLAPIVDREALERDITFACCLFRGAAHALFTRQSA